MIYIPISASEDSASSRSLSLLILVCASSSESESITMAFCSKESLALVTDDSLGFFLKEMLLPLLLAFHLRLLAPSAMACAAFTVSLETRLPSLDI
jgi:hypothetical protein